MGMEIAITKPAEFTKWMRTLAPAHRARITDLLDTLAAAPHPLTLPQGRNLGDNLWELRSTTGHRVYYYASGNRATVVTYGRKDTQSRDIARARRREP